MVSVQDVVFIRTHAIGHRFAARELAFGFHIDVHVLECNQRGIDDRADRQGVVHRRSGVPALFRPRQVKVRELVDKVAFWPMARPQLRQVFTLDQGALAHVRTDHGNRPAGVENDLCGFRIVVDIGFRGSVDIASADRAAHDHNVVNQRHDGRILRNRQGDIRERTDRNQGDLVRIGMDHLDDQIGPEAPVSLAVGGRQLHVRQTVLAVPELRGDQLLIQGMLGAARNRNIAASRQRDDLQRVLQALRCFDVTGHHRQSFHLELGRIERQQDRHRVVDARIGINNHAPRRGQR